MIKFTLVEVVVAVAILIGVVAGTAQIMAMSAKRSATAENLWLEQHILTQATEYFLLDKPNATIPQRFFPFPGYSAKSSYKNVEESGEWLLVEMEVVLFYKNSEISILNMRRIVQRGDL